MDRDLAQIVSTTAARVRAELGDLMPLLKEHDVGEEDKSVRAQIAASIYEIGLIMDGVFEEHPDLRVEYESRIQRFGRSIG